ncbi:MAG TPA: hypothetical protein VEK57_10090, partial [Thermoanaerobaculia bacterium]|nr:hypothetical protein [Thermoanaerobaculia bacterium]
LPLFEVMPLIRHLRTLIEGARPLRPTDLTLSLETAQAQDEAMSIDFAAIDGARKALDAVRKALDQFAPAPKIDQTIDVLATILSSAALFGIPQTGWGFLYDQRAALFRAVLKNVAAAAARFDERRDEFNAVMAEYQGLPAAATTAERFEVLYRAERLISTSVFAAANPAQLETELATVKGPAFGGQQSLLADVQKTTRAKIGDLLSDVKLLPPLAPFTFDNLSFAEEDAGVAVLAEDAVRVAKVVLKEVEGRLAAANQRLGEANDAAAAKARVQALDAAAKAMFGEHFTVVPRFSLGAKQGDEIGQSLAASESGALFSYLEGPEQNLDFPVDTWLYGVARVREKMRAWEGMTMLAEAFGVTPAPSLTALQFPFVQDEPWLALDLPIAEGEPGLTLQLPSGKLKVDGERLLYTAAMTTAFDKTAPQCGLLLDEWTEVIPARDIDTGVAFHFDRPNSEAPQAMLLVTPSDFRGKWLWSDVVDALNDTLAFAKRRAVEPDQLDQTEYSRFLPATMMAVTFGQASISAAAIQTALEVKP